MRYGGGTKSKRMRTSDLRDRSVQQQRKRCTVRVRVLPNTDALFHFVNAALVEIDEECASDINAYIILEMPGCKNRFQEKLRISGWSI